MAILKHSNDGLRELALFAGAGGGILGGHLLGWRTVCAVERDAYAASVLAQRQNDGLLAPFPIWSDVCSFDGRPWRGIIDVVSVGFPAKTSAQQDAAQASTAHAAVCGEKWHASSVKYDRDTSMWKTAQCLWDEDLPASSVTLPRWGMTRNGALYQHKTLVRPTNATEFGYAPQTQTWATPTTMDKLPPKSAEALHREATIARPGRTRPANLRDQVSNGMNWPTPRAGDGNRNGSKPQEHWNRSFSGNWLRDAVQLHPQKIWPTPTVCGNNNRKGLSATSGDGLATAVKNWPTPQASDVRDRGNLSSGSTQRRIAKGKQINLSMSVSEESGQLNPDWVEWLMGWPTGWTSLEPLDRSTFEAWQQNIATQWHAEPTDVPRVISGMAFRGYRLKAIGNGQVSRAAAAAWRILESD